MIRRVRQFFEQKSTDDAKLPTVAVVGALRCGTNYLKFLVEQAFFARAEFNSFGWKHAGVPVFAAGSSLSYPDVPLVYVSKNPYAFVVSLYRYQQRKVTQGHKISLETRSEGDLDVFLRCPIQIFDSQVSGSPRLHFANPIQYWNFFYGNLGSLEAPQFRAIGFNYEDLIESTELIRSARIATGLKERDGALLRPENHLKRLSGLSRAVSGNDLESSEAFDATYYAEKRYLEGLTREQLEFIGFEVDPVVMMRRGYDVF